MKKSILARGFIGSVASLLGVMAVGCGADVMDEGAAGDSAEIGSTGQALTVAALNTALDFNQTAHEWAASCKVTLSGVDYMVVYGGYALAGGGLDQLSIYKPGTGAGNNTWTTLSTIASLDQPNDDNRHLNQGRGEAQFVKLSATSCLLVGGLSQKGTAGTALRRAYQLTVTSPTTVTWADAGLMNEGRAKFGSAPCGSGKAIVMGGRPASSQAAEIDSANSIEVWDGSTTWTGIDDATNKILDPRVHSLALAPKSSTEFFVAGGMNGGNAMPDVQAIEVNAACTAIATSGGSPEVSYDVLKNSANNASEARFGALAFFKPSSDDVLVVTGDTGAALPTHAELFDVDFTTSPPTITHQTSPFSNLTGARYATLAIDTTNTRWGVLGGEDRTGGLLVSQPLTKAQDIRLTSGAFSHSTANDDTLKTPRGGATAEFLPSDANYFVTGGMSEDSTFAVTVETDKIAP